MFGKMNLRKKLTKINLLSKGLSLCGLILLILFSVPQPYFVNLSHTQPLGSIQVAAQEANDNIVFSMFPACEEADLSTEGLTRCIREIVLFSFYIGIVVFFIRVAYIAIVSLSNPGNSSIYKGLKEAVYGLITGVVFIGMPITIMSLINPLSGQITFNFLEEINLGPEASLIDVTPSATGCPGFARCVETCVNTRSGGDKRNNCVSTCKSDYPNCEKCHEYIQDNGVGLASDDFQKCVSPTIEAGSGSRRSGSVAGESDVRTVDCGGGLVCEDMPRDEDMPEGYEDPEAIKCLIMAEAEQLGVTDRSHIAYILGTIQIETGYVTMTEYATTKQDGCGYEGRADLNNTQSCDGALFIGRGYVQLTGRGNYQKYTDIINNEFSDRFGTVDLVNDPGLVSRDPEIAAFITVHGMYNGSFTGVGLPDFGSGDTFNFERARTIVNDNDKNNVVAAEATKYLRDGFPSCN